ncbi:MAG: coproporphyrinogen III oxidase family protein [Clostridiales bacterium]|jgi:oxygen-independent coproporphyrinogen-3 oxidase|nr:coproporphyrinogen III oxidase family protein [Clostridiales bacterium]
MRYKERYKSHHDASKALKARFNAETDKAAYLAGLLGGPAKSRRALYVHVPFCNKICSFCPFHRPDELRRREYHAYLIRGMRQIGGYPYMRAPIDAVNFGGGTPTALSPVQMGLVLREIKNTFDIRENAEISVETSVSELTDEMLGVLRDGGVNRLSVGVQTFDDNARKTFNRRGSGEKAAERLRAAVNGGFSNTGIDLIYNYPGQTPDMLKRDLDTVKSLNLSGVSFYSLMLHEKTPLYGKLTDADRNEMNDTAREYRLFQMILDELRGVGYGVFELTKMIRADLDRYDYIRIRHGGGSCIALGQGAGGNLENYIYRNAAGAPPVSGAIAVSAHGRVVTDEYRVIDEFIHELQRAGVDLGAYSPRFGADLAALLAKPLDELRAGGYIAAAGGGIRFTDKGLFWGNNIIDELARRLLAAEDGRV